MLNLQKRVMNTKLMTRRSFLIAYDIMAVCLACIAPLWIRYEFHYNEIPSYFVNSVWHMMPFSVILTLVVFWVLRLYHSLWAYAGVTEMQNIVVACFVSAALQGVGLAILHDPVPRSYYFIYAFVLMAFTMLSRFSYRFARETRHRVYNKKRNVISVMIVGAGDAGNTLIKEINSSYHSTMIIKCIIDEDPNKWGRYVQGIKIVGGRDKIVENARLHSIDEIIIAMPSAPRPTIKGLIEVCQETNCKLRTLPGIYQLVNGEVDVSKIRDVDVEDLLGRDPITINLDKIMGYVQGKTVLVTGGGGSIGSELCRQIATHHPKQLIIVDIYENNAYEIQQEL